MRGFITHWNPVEPSGTQWHPLGRTMTMTRLRLDSDYDLTMTDMRHQSQGGGDHD